ncbi:MAG: Na/Pi cotransporter family protein [Ruminococcus sp.]|nr:Na/Pi cotransporter family protein [Ruminococcus sp.]
MGDFSIFNIFTMLGGLAFFLYGMNVMSTGLEKLAGGKMEVALKKMTANPFMALILGTVITIAIQSSSAMTVMTVGFVNSGIMALIDTVAVSFGANIGTTFTAWLLCLNGIEGGDGVGGVGGFLMKLLKPDSFSPILALVGILMIMGCKKAKKKDIGRIFVGFAVHMTGMDLMQGAIDPVANSPEFQNVLMAFNNPLVGVIVGALFTGIIQSSAASIGILMTFSAGGALTYEMSLPLIMGFNIGTCVTALISSIGVNKDAKRVSVIHVAINCLGTLIFLPVALILKETIPAFADFMSQPTGYMGIAAMHTVFNVLATIVLMPFSKYLVKFSQFVIRDKEGEPKEQIDIFAALDGRFMSTPSIAVEACRSVAVDMADRTQKAISDAIGLLVTGYDEKTVQSVIEAEDLIDKYEDKINSYLVRVAKYSITGKDSRTMSKMMHCVGNFERISDHAVNLIESVVEMKEKGIMFSAECINEITVISDAIRENISTAFEAYKSDELSVAHKVEPLEEVVDNLSTELKNRHIRRLQNDECTVELGYIFQDVLTNLERISDHCSNIAGCLIETDEKTNIHAYFSDVKENDEKFRNEYKEYSELYFTRLDIKR